MPGFPKSLAEAVNNFNFAIVILSFLHKQPKKNIMKKFFIIASALFFLMPFVLKSQVNTAAKPNDTLNRTDASGLKTGFWEEKAGDVTLKGYFKLNKKEGSWVGFYPSNVLARIDTYKDGQKDGPYIQLDRRGKITLYEYYRNGLLNGQQVSYAPSGDFPVSETNYVNGKRNGLYRLYYDNGKIQEESDYVENQKNGSSKWFNKGGKLLAEYNYKLGNFEGIQKTFYDNDTLQILSSYTNNELSGDYKEFYRNGKLKMTGKYIKGQKDGPWTCLLYTSPSPRD